MIIFIILVILVVVLFYKFIRPKILKVPNVYLVTGGVKTGKSFLSVWLALRQYKRNLFAVKVKRFFQKIFKKELSELPMLYSNIKLRNIRYNIFTVEMLERKVRIPYKSVVLIDEASLLADSMYYKDQDANERLMLFVKLFGHYSRGGSLIINTQSLHDMHYAFKRGISTYLWIHSKIKLPFFTIMKVKEMMFSDDTDKSIDNNLDVEENLKTLIVPNKFYNYYDCYCYSIFTDNKDVYVDYDQKILFKKDSLKTNDLVSVREFKSLKEEKKDEKN